MKSKIIGLDSLRLFAIILIVVYHCFPEVLPGGFVAVEIFFAISGFLIGAKLIRKFSAKNKTKENFYKGFWKFFLGRLKRLLPALLLCMIITLSIAYFTDLDLLTKARQNSLYAATFSTNIAAIINGSSYESQLIPNLFNHTWFLALELQVCLIIYVIFAIFFYFNKQAGKKRYVKLAILCTIISVFSFALMALYGGRFGLYDRAYFGIDTHIGAFFLGAALAAFTTLKKKLFRVSSDSFVWIVFLILEITLTLLATPSLNYNSPVTFLYALPIVSILSVLMIFSILKLQPKNPVKFLKPFEYLGKISFYLYLFHWPLFILFKDIMKGFYPEFAPYVAILISLILAILADKIILPFFLKKQRVINYIIIAVSLVLPVMSLIKAPNVSSIEESLKPSESEEETGSEPSETSEPVATKADYTGTNALGNNLNNEIFSYFNEAAGFAKVYIPAPAAGYASGGGFIAQSTRTSPTLSSASLAALNRLSVMVVGDSVTLGAKNQLSARGYFVDAVGSRNMLDGITLLAGYRAANGGNLPHVIVVALVPNYSNITTGMLQNLMNTIGPGHRLILVTNTCRQYSRESQNNAIKTFASWYGNVDVADWAPLVSANLAAYTGSDGLHLTSTGRIAYANFLSSVIGY